MMNTIVPLEIHQLEQWEPQKVNYYEAQAEAVKQYAKAIKDWDLLDDAIDQQIDNQRLFCEWWAVNVGVRFRAGDNQYTSLSAELRSTMSAEKAEDLTSISHQKVARWNARRKDLNAYRAMLRGPAYRVAMANDDIDHTDNTNDQSAPRAAPSTANDDTNTNNTDNTGTAVGASTDAAPDLNANDNTDADTDSDYIDNDYDNPPITINLNDPVGRIIRGTAGTGEFERYTPAKYIEIARTVMGTIDVDPASCEVAQKIVKATTFFTIQTNGLNKEWIGNVWLNPPYHRELGPMFIDKLVVELLAGRTTQAIMLTNNSTDTDWFVKAQTYCNAICFAKVRVAFLEKDGLTELAPTQGQAFFYFGDNMELFCKEFCKIGFIVTSFINFNSTLG